MSHLPFVENFIKFFFVSGVVSHDLIMERDLGVSQTASTPWALVRFPVSPHLYLLQTYRTGQRSKVKS